MKPPLKQGDKPIFRHKNGLFDEMLLPSPSKKILDWFRKPLKKVGKIYGVTIITIKPFPKL